MRPQPAAPTRTRRISGIRISANLRRGSERLGLRFSSRVACRGEPGGDKVQVGDEISRARVPGPGVLRQKLENYGLQLRGYTPSYLPGGPRRLVHVLHGDGDRRVGLEGHLAREHLVEDDAEGVEVARGADLAAHRLLRRHVPRRAEHRARPGDHIRRRGPGYAEIGDFHVACSGHEHVLGLYVPVDQAPLVRRPEGVGDLDGHGRGGVRGQGPVPDDAVFESTAGHVFHGYVVAPVFRNSPVVDLDDVRVGERRDAQGLAPEPLDELLVLRVLPAKHLHGHVSLQNIVASQEHSCHTSAAQKLGGYVAAVDSGNFLHE